MISEIQRFQKILIVQGALILLLGFIIGFGFLFFIEGEISLFPLPWRIHYQLPGTYDAWRMAHLEGIANGFMLWILAALLPALSTMFKSIRWLVVVPIIIAWSIVIASSFDPIFPNARGLVLNEDTGLMNDIAFFIFYPGVVLSFFLVIRIILAGFGRSGSKNS